MSTPAYINAVAKLHSSSETAPGAEVTALPSSIKFTPATTSRELHVLADGPWISEFPGAMDLLRSACALKSAKWRLYLVGAKDAWLRLRTSATDAIKASRRNSIVSDSQLKSELDETFVHLVKWTDVHRLVRQHSIVDRARSTYGKFAPRFTRGAIKSRVTSSQLARQ